LVEDGLKAAYCGQTFQIACADFYWWTIEELGMAAFLSLIINSRKSMTASSKIRFIPQLLGSSLSLTLLRKLRCYPQIINNST